MAIFGMAPEMFLEKSGCRRSLDLSRKCQFVADRLLIRATGALMLYEGPESAWLPLRPAPCSVSVSLEQNERGQCRRRLARCFDRQSIGRAANCRSRHRQTTRYAQSEILRYFATGWRSPGVLWCHGMPLIQRIRRIPVHQKKSPIVRLGEKLADSRLGGKTQADQLAIL